jgi:hypothetical protein
MQMRSQHLGAVLITAITFQHGHVSAQTVSPRSVTGAVTDLNFQTRELAVTTEDGTSVQVKVSMDTTFLRVAPGVHDLSTATPASPHDIKVGDHVMASYVDGMTEARRIVFDREEHSLLGVVSAKTRNEITAEQAGDVKTTITVTSKTKFRRYAPDSVTFTQATSSSIDEVATGDQIRASGETTGDGLKMTADEVVFGTFWTKGGQITAIDPHTREVTIQEVGTKRPLVVKLAAESKLKMLPDRKTAKAPDDSPRGAVAANHPTTRSGAIDLAKTVGSLPAVKMEGLKIGGAVIVSSAKGVQEGRITAILLLANADMFVHLMQLQSDGKGDAMEQFLKGHGTNPARGLSLPAIFP